MLRLVTRKWHGILERGVHVRVDVTSGPHNGHVVPLIPRLPK